MRGARVAAAAGKADGRAGVSACWAGLLGQVLQRASRAGLLGQAGRAGCGPSPFLSFFCFYFSSPLFKFKFDSGI